MVIFCAPVKLKNRPSFLRSSGSRAMPAAIASAGERRFTGAAAQPDLTAGQRIDSEQCAGDFAPARAQHSAESEYLAATEC